MNEVEKLVADKLEELAMLQYTGSIKGCLILVIDKDNVFRLMEAYSSDVLFAMNVAIDVAKDHLIGKVKSHLTEPPKEL